MGDAGEAMGGQFTMYPAPVDDLNAPEFSEYLTFQQLLDGALIRRLLVGACCVLKGMRLLLKSLFLSLTIFPPQV